MSGRKAFSRDGQNIPKRIDIPQFREDFRGKAVPTENRWGCQRGFLGGVSTDPWEKRFECQYLLIAGDQELRTPVDG